MAIGRLVTFIPSVSQDNNIQNTKVALRDCIDAFLFGVRKLVITKG